MNIGDNVPSNNPPIVGKVELPKLEMPFVPHDTMRLSQMEEILKHLRTIEYYLQLLVFGETKQ